MYEYAYNALFDYSVVLGLLGVILIRYARNSYTSKTIMAEACLSSSKRLIKYTNHSKINKFKIASSTEKCNFFQKSNLKDVK